jgi:hypothetical protein
LVTNYVFPSGITYSLSVTCTHRHLKNIDCLSHPVCFISTVNGSSNKKKKRKEEPYPWKAGASSRHITNLKQSILETFDIYACTIKIF